MKIVSHKEIMNLGISAAECYEWVDEMLRNKKNTLLPPKISIKPSPGIFCNVMPSYIYTNSSKKCVGGVKIVTRYPAETPSLNSKIYLIDANSGAPKALMDANWITAMRTGAVAAHSINLLARKDFKTIGMVGLGNTARSALLVLAEIMQDRKFKIKLLQYKGQENSFIERFSAYKNLLFECYDTPEDVIQSSDVVISAATYLPEDLCEDEFFSPGVLVVPIHTLGFTNCDLFFDKIFADDYGHVCHFKNFNKFPSFAEISDVVNNKVPGRENDDERILVYNIGVSIHDINFASHIYNRLDNNKLSDFDFHEPKDKFWV